MYVCLHVSPQIFVSLVVLVAMTFTSIVFELCVCQAHPIVIEPLFSRPIDYMFDRVLVTTHHHIVFIVCFEEIKPKSRDLTKPNTDTPAGSVMLTFLTAVLPWSRRSSERKKGDEHKERERERELANYCKCMCEFVLVLMLQIDASKTPTENCTGGAQCVSVCLSVLVSILSPCMPLCCSVYCIYFM